MKNRLIVTVIACSLLACEPKLEGPSFDNGNADFSKFLAFGGSYTAGFADADLYKSAQEASFPSLIAEELKTVGGGNFKQPLMLDNYGFGNRMVLDYVTDCRDETTLFPKTAEETPNAGNEDNISGQGPYNNIGVPSMRAIDIQSNIYHQNNPYYKRLKNESQKNVLGHVSLVKPTFFTLWLGVNDVLNYALTGAALGTQVSNENAFENAMRACLDSLTKNGAKGVVANIPYVTTLPHFTAIPYNALEITQEQADQLNLVYAANAEVSFQEGPNAFVIQEGTKIRHLKSNERIVLSLPLDDVKCNNYGSIIPFRDEHVLTEEEIDDIKIAVNDFNLILKSLAAEYNIGLVDISSFVESLDKDEITFDGVNVNTSYVSGGLFSLDGVHFTPRGNALVANEFIKTINKFYNANVPFVNAVAHHGVVFPD